MSDSDKLLRQEHPVNVEAVGVKVSDWLGDDEPFLNIEFQNTSKLNAYKFKACLYNNRNEPLNLSQTKTSNVFYKEGFSITPEQKILFPLGPEREIKEAIQDQIKDGKNIKYSLKDIDFIQENRMKEIKEGEEISIRLKQIVLPLKYEYFSPFGEKIQKKGSVCVTYEVKE